MTRAPVLAWVLLGVWSAWLFAVQGLVASADSLGTWTPELGLVLVLALDGHMRGRGARGVALLVSAARIAVGTDPPLAVVAGYLGFVGLTAGLRSTVEIDRPLPRALLAAAAALGLSAYWRTCRILDAGDVVGGLDVLGVWPHAVSTAIAALFLPPVLARLPGLTPLWGRRR